MKKREHLKEIASRFTEVRHQQGLSRQEMADRLGIGPSGYGRYERGEIYPSHLLLRKILEKFDISLDWLIYNKPPMRRSAIRKALEEQARMEKEKLQQPPPDPEMDELIEHMREDRLLRIEVLRFFYRLRQEAPPVPQEQEN